MHAGKLQQNKRLRRVVDVKCHCQLITRISVFKHRRVKMETSDMRSIEMNFFLFLFFKMYTRKVLIRSRHLKKQVRSRWVIWKVAFNLKIKTWDNHHRETCWITSKNFVTSPCCCLQKPTRISWYCTTNNTHAKPLLCSITSCYASFASVAVVGCLVKTYLWYKTINRRMNHT